MTPQQMLHSPGESFKGRRTQVNIKASESFLGGLFCGLGSTEFGVHLRPIYEKNERQPVSPKPVFAHRKPTVFAAFRAEPPGALYTHQVVSFA